MSSSTARRREREAAVVECVAVELELRAIGRVEDSVGGALEEPLVRPVQLVPHDQNGTGCDVVWEHAQDIRIAHVVAPDDVGVL